MIKKSKPRTAAKRAKKKPSLKQLIDRLLNNTSSNKKRPATAKKAKKKPVVQKGSVKTSQIVTQKHNSKKAAAIRTRPKVARKATATASKKAPKSSIKLVKTKARRKVTTLSRAKRSTGIGVA